ncbi:5-oxoprolinase subunit PxpA [Croceitalea sp. MTPC5]|uniref:5-oxoprolinase subunit PxpA n=1 Tax=Croceitalea sp. MTPC5 TaxID=3056565 RepID=UPI002B38626F|nr:5-oxoprolinase subunit PxpA [Croceitalea sp. MTPC5]
MERIAIDINCDVGEGIGNEAQLLPLTSSCNIACGGHAGDEATIKEVIQLAKMHQVKIGAHPSYPDRINFGRSSMDITPHALKRSIRDQLQLFERITIAEKATFHHIKAHGALYNNMAKDISLAKVYLESVSAYRDKCHLYVPYNTVIAKEALKQGFRIKYEAFADRNYSDGLNLLPRSSAKALITKPEAVLKHILRMVKESSIQTPSGKRMEIKADTFCIHGDTSSAFEILMYLSTELPKHQVNISK